MRVLLHKVKEFYLNHKRIVEIEKRAGLRESLFLTLKRKYILYKQKRKAYILGQRAARGKNIYLTFGSEKTCPKSGEESYKRYAMAMKYYKQNVCDRESFLDGFKKFADVNT